MSQEFPELLNSRAFAGRIKWIGIAPIKSGRVRAQQQIELQTGAGIVGDHHFREHSESRRQVTFIQSEHLPAVSALLQSETIDPGLLRRNIVVSGINLASLKQRSFRIGSAILQGTGDCPPCNRMEENLGTGGYAAMVGHGGITTIVLKGGVVAVGDEVTAENAINGGVSDRQTVR